MRNKGIVVFLTVVVTLLCLYYLSFTFVSRDIQADATAYATQADGSVNFSKKQAYLDSIWHEPVYSFLGIEYTYKDIKETELNLGLDLQGGMHVTLEVSPVEIVKGLSGHSEDPDFQRAIEIAKERRTESQDRFVELFYDAFVELKGEGQLADVFANAANRERISLTSTDSEVLSVIRDEVENAIDRSFQIIRTRVDRFGTSQPNIQRLQGTGRIQVELPGVDNEERVRRLLQGTAKLEFLEVVEINQVAETLEAINAMIVAENRAQAPAELTEEVAEEATEPTETEEADLEDALTQEDTTAEGDLAAQLEDEADADLDLEVSPLFSLLKAQGGLIYSVRDTSQINRILQREDVQDMLPANISFVWSVKPFVPEGSDEGLLELYAVERERGGRAPLGGEVVTDARQDFDQRGTPAVSMNMNAEGARAWKRLTAANINERIAIVLDNFVYSAPTVQGEIGGGTSSITGNFSLEEAKDLANILKAGALPAPATIVEEAIVGPTLGEMARNQGILSMVAGLGIVVLFVIAYYASGGMVANIALLFNIFFVFGVLAQLNAALTLPGIAGIILTIGMSIDANVLIFERIREERRLGSALGEAIRSGYNKAYSSIIDANVTTLLVAVILYVFGQGPVRGFAITLIIGIICSLFSAVLITRVIIDWMAARKAGKGKVSFSTPFSKNLFANMNVDFLGRRKLAYVVSGLVIAVGMAVMVLGGGLNMGVDFTGGRSYVVTFSEPVAPTQLKVALADDLVNAGTEVKTYGANNVLKVTTSYLIGEEGLEIDDEVKDALVGGIAEFTGSTFVDNSRELGANQFTISSSSKVGATIADDIVDSSYTSALFALAAIFLYILVRFSKWQYSVGAIVALAHDVLITLSAFAIAGALGMTYEVDQVFVAAILTIIGYSINDTVVVFDRVREEVSLHKGGSLLNVFNGAINNTMNRTMITSVTTFFVLLVLFLFGGEVLKGFSFALLVGIVIGTYSSIFVATPIVADLTKKEIGSGKAKQAAQKA